MAETLELVDEAAAVALGVFGVAAVEELFAEVVVSDALLEDVVGGGQDLVAGRNGGFGVPAAALDAVVAGAEVCALRPSARPLWSIRSAFRAAIWGPCGSRGRGGALLAQMVCGLTAELEERGIAVEISETAGARLTRVDIGRTMLRNGAIEIAGPYSERRLRALPGRRYDTERKVWQVPLTRAGATAIPAIVDGSDDLVITQRARRALEQSASATATARRSALDTVAPPEPTRRSPIAHWRHFTAGPVFDKPARPRLDVAGIGLCVRIRVDPGR